MNENAVEPRLIGDCTLYPLQYTVVLNSSGGLTFHFLQHGEVRYSVLAVKKSMLLNLSRLPRTCYTDLCWRRNGMDLLSFSAGNDYVMRLNVVHRTENSTRVFIHRHAALSRLPMPPPSARV